MAEALTSEGQVQGIDQAKAGKSLPKGKASNLTSPIINC